MNPRFWQYLLPQHFLSKVYGLLAHIETPWIKNAFIRKFVRDYPVDLNEAEISTPEGFTHFNDFFTRALKPGLRVIDPAPNTITSPVDGALSAFGKINQAQLIQAKNHQYTVADLLANNHPELLKIYDNGLFATIYLAPHDYHRIHMPLDGHLKSMTYIPGKLFSVNLKTADNISNLFAKNERVVLEFETPQGPMMLVLVGAMIVASISTVFSGLVQPHGKDIIRKTYPNTNEQHIFLKKGDEVARFLLGSTVVMLFGNQSAAFNDALEIGQKIQLGNVMSQID